MVIGDRGIADDHAQHGAGREARSCVAELLGKLFDPRAWFSSLGGMDEALQRMAEGPRLADVWDTERKLLNAVQRLDGAAPAQHRAQHRHAGGLDAGGRRFRKDLNEKADRKETLGSWREVLALWVETANTALLETQRSENYLKSQREILKASTDLRLAQQELAAFYSEMFGYPDARRARRCASHRDRASARAARASSAPAANAHERTEKPPRRSQPQEPSMTRTGARHHDRTERPIHIKPEQAIAEAAALGEKIARGAELFSKLRDEDVTIATTPKDEVWRQDKVTLHHYRPLAEKKISTPVLIVYGLIGRYTMADLQEDRSLVRNLLNLGVDLYVVDWGNPSRADRWLTLDDYIDGYLAECVEVISRAPRHRQGQPARHLRRRRLHHLLCGAASGHGEGARAHHHADRFSRRHGREPARPRLHQSSGRAVSTPEDIDRLIEAYGNLPGEFMGSVFSHDDADAHADEVQSRHAGSRWTTRRSSSNFLRMEKWIADRPHHPGEAAKQWLKDLYQDNKLINNAFTINGRQVNLAQHHHAGLNVFAKDDHIIPPATSQALGAKVGHQGLYASWRCRAGMSAYSSAASRRPCSAPGSPTGWPRGSRRMALKNKIVSADEAIAIIRDGDTVCVSGFVGIGTPDELILALERRFLRNVTRPASP